MSQSYYEIDPWFWQEIEERREDNSNSVIAVIGPNNWGKSWWAIRLAEEMHEKWRLPRFTAEAIVFNAHQFWLRMRDSQPDEWTVWDEPNKGLSNKQWWNEMNKAVTAFIQTMRFKRKNLILAMPNDKMVDKGARAVFLARAKMLRPGLAGIEQIVPDYYGTKEYYTYGRGEVELYSPSRKLINEYDKRKEEFHLADFPESEFQEKPIIQEKSWQAVKRKILEDPPRYQRQTGNKTGVFVYSARKIAALLDCSDNTARRAIDKIQIESEPSE